MTAKILKLVVICLTLSAGVYAASEDVALITALTGVATATWVESAVDGSPNADENRRSHEWSIEIAEMLPVGAEITTGAESELTLIHLAGNVEYNLGASAQARITQDRVEGVDLVSMPVKLVSANLEMSAAMQNQVGAVIPDHVDGQVSKIEDSFDSGGNKSVSFGELRREMRDKGSELSIEIQPSPAPAPTTVNVRMPATPTPSEELDVTTDHESKVDLEETAESDAAKKREMPQTIAMVEASFALPREILAKVYPADANLDVENYEIDVVADFGGWVNFNFQTNMVERDFNLKIRGKSGVLPITLHVENAAPSVVYAWRLEKSGLLAQAASIWLKLQAEGMSEKKVAPHLKRIREKLLQPQN